MSERRLATWETYSPLYKVVFLLEIGMTPIVILVLCIVYVVTSDPSCSDGQFFENNSTHACNLQENGALVSSMQNGFHFLEGSINPEEIMTRGIHHQFLLVEETLNEVITTRIFLNGEYLVSLPPGLVARNIYFIDEDAVEYYDRRGRFTICYRYEYQSELAFPVRDYANILQVASAQ